MALVDFGFGAGHRFQAAARVIYKRVQQYERVLVYCPDDKRQAMLSKLLWQVDEVAFVPIVNLQQSEPFPQCFCQAQVLITADTPSLEWVKEGDRIWLLNLANTTPPSYELFPRLIEIVSQHPEDRRLARLRWKYYQSRGDQLRSFQLDIT